MRIKRKTIIITLILLLSVCLVCCVYTLVNSPIPYGKWENTEFGIMIDVNPNMLPNATYNGRYIGHVTKQGEIIPTCIKFSFDNQLIIITDQTNESTIYHMGSVRQALGRLYLIEREESGVNKIIVFNKIVEYDVPENIE